MKVLIINRDFPPHASGGMSRVTSYLEKFSECYGLNITIIADQPVLKISKEIKKNVVIYRVPAIGSTFLTKIPSFGYFASGLVSKIQKDYDLIYSNYSPIFFKMERPFIVHFQGTRYGEYLACKMMKKYIYAFLNRIYVLFDRIILKNANGVIILSENMMKEIKATGEYKNKKIVVIPNGVDTEIFRPLKQREFNSSEKKVLYVGRLDLRKGIDILFYSFAELARKIKVKLIVVGEGREKNRLLALAKSLSISVEFKGKIPNIGLPQVYNEADLLVLPSIYEPFGLVAVEAMACATPTLVSDAVSIEGVSKFKSGNVNNLSQVLLEILSSESKLRELSQKCFKIAQGYKWEKVVFKIIEFLKKF